MATTDDNRIRAEHERADQDQADKRLLGWARRTGNSMKIADAMLVRDFPGLFG